jgi:hypothetical protein
MIYTIEKRLNSKAFSGKKCIFRIHESGDFYNVEYTRKWIKICKHFENDERITFLAYTKSISYFVASGYGKTPLPDIPENRFPSNLIVRSSIWADTENSKVVLTNLYNFPIYTAGTPEEVVQMKNDGFKVCKCENCSTCRMCWNDKCKNITCEIH